MDNSVFSMLECLYKDKGMEAVVDEVFRLYNNMPECRKRTPKKGIQEVYDIEQKHHTDPKKAWYRAICDITGGFGNFDSTNFISLGDITRFICTVTERALHPINPFDMVAIVKEQDSKGGPLLACQFLAGYTLVSCGDPYMAATALYNLYTYLLPEIGGCPIPDYEYVRTAVEDARNIKLTTDEMVRIGERVFIKNTTPESPSPNTTETLDLMFWVKHIQTFLEIDNFLLGKATDMDALEVDLMCNCSEIPNMHQLCDAMEVATKKYGIVGRINYLIGHMCYYSHFMDKKLVGSFLYALVQLYAKEADMSGFMPNVEYLKKQTKKYLLEGYGHDYESLVWLGQIFLGDKETFVLNDTL